MFTAIMEIFALIAHLLSTSVRVAGPGGVRAVIAESLLLKHQLIVLNRARKRAPRLTRWDRLLFGIGAFWVAPNRLPKIAIGIRPSTLLRFHLGADPAEILTPIHAPNPSATRALELTRFRGHLMVRFGGVRDGRQECSIYAGV